MSNNLREASFFRIKSLNGPDRYVDVLIGGESMEVVEPYFFLYDYGQTDRTIGYILPAEGLNHDEVNENTSSFMGTNIRSKNQVLKYTNSVYFPQLHYSTYDSSILEPRVIDVVTGSEDNSLGDSMGHIYLMLKKGEYELQLFRRNPNYLDPYYMAIPSEAVPLLSSNFSLERPDLDLRSIVVTLSADRALINYSQAIFGDEVETPVKWVISNPKKHVKGLPSIDKINSLFDTIIKVENENLIVNGVNVGKKSTNLDLLSSPITDMDISITNTIIINSNILSSDQPFQ